MVRCGSRTVSQILVGLDRVGLAGLEAAFAAADASGLEGREEIVDLLRQAVDRRNYVPAGSEEDYRQALWREYQRHRGEDIRDLYSEVEVLIRAEAGESERLAADVAAALAEHELRPAMHFDAPDRSVDGAQVVIAGHLVAEGAPTAGALRKAIKTRLDDW
jgi:hypothetical protein